MKRYQIQFVLGEGSMAKVYAAHDTVMDREVALKILHDAAAANENVRQRFLREARIAAGLSHPNLVTVHDAGAEGGKLFLVMELIEGESLDHALRQSSRPLRELVGVLEHAARGVHHAHLKGAVHRDLKPANILLPKSGPPKVTDFGLAHLMQADSPLSRSGVPLGTPVYMAPEQARGLNDRITARTDVYALGAILYEILTRRPPFDGKTVVEIYRKIIRQPVLPPRRPGAAVPEPLERICLKALEKSPDRRYATAEEFADDLAAWLAGREVRARKVSAFRRRPLPWILGPAAVVLAVAIAAVFIPRGAPSPSAAPVPAPSAAQPPVPADLLAHLRLRGAEALATLDAQANGGRPPGVEAALSTAESLASSHATSADGRAWLAHARHLAGKGEPPSAALTTDPAAKPLIVRDRLAAYARLLRVPNVGFGAAGFRVDGLAETPDMVRVRQEALQSAPGSGEFREVAEALAQMGRQEYAPAAERLAPVDDPLLRDPVRWVRGCARLFLGRPADAEPDFEALVARGWPEAVFYSGVCRMCLGVQAQVAGTSGLADLRRAVERFGKRLEAGEDTTVLQYRAVARMWVGSALLARNEDPRPEFAAGLEDVERILAVRPDLRNSWMTRGNLHQTRGDALASRRLDPEADFRAAIESYGRAMQLNPRDPSAPQARAGAYIRLGNLQWQRQNDPIPSYVAAVKDLRTAAETAPRPAEVLFQCAQVRQSAARYLRSKNQDPSAPLKDAVQDLKMATDADPRHGDSWLLAVEILNELGDLERAAGRDPVPIYRQALAFADRAVELQPKSPKVLTYRGNAQQRLANHGDEAARQARYQEAYASFEKALAADPDFWNAMTGKATILESLGRPDEAVLWYEKALVAGKDNPGCQSFCQAALKRLKSRGE